MAGAGQFPVRVPRGIPVRIDSRAPRRLNSDRDAAPCHKGNEWALVQQAIAGNASAQEQLFARPTRRLYRVVFALLQNKEDAEDALQDGLCKAYSSLRTFQGRSSFSTWLTRIVINSARMARRRRIAHVETSLDEMLDNQAEQLPRGVVDARPNPEKLYAETEFNARVEQHVSQLPPALQEAFRLDATNGISGLESSKALGISPSAFKSRIFRARGKLVCALQRSLEISATGRQLSTEVRMTRDSAHALGVNYERIVTKKTGSR
jgi:RNA polymerase sigma-70 factor (ECF subfamily)